MARFAELGFTVLSGSPADFAKLIAEETEKWGRVIRAANIKVQYRHALRRELDGRRFSRPRPQGLL
jgi:hypothetical protein